MLIMKKIAILLFLGFTSIVASAQSGGKPTIAVAYPAVAGVGSNNSASTSKMIRLELIKLGIYSVYDEYDMSEIIKDNAEFTESCLGIACLTEMGKALGVDYVLSGSVDGLSNRIAVSLKLVDVKTGTLSKSMVREFDDQTDELQRMIEVLLKEMHGITPEKELVDRIKYNNELITTNNVGKINNSGPRVGYGVLVGSEGMGEFANRETQYGGLGIFPGISMIGYQLEGQYVGTENFSALVECLITISGLEQSTFIPSVAILNGFRFGKGGWEFAFGPGFGVKKMDKGFFDKDDHYGRGNGAYWGREDLIKYYNDETAFPEYFDAYGNYIAPNNQQLETIAEGYDYALADHFDTRGESKFSTTWIMAFGRTFRAGSLSIPVNVFYSATKGGGYVGASIGFNVQTKKQKINR